MTIETDIAWSRKNQQLPLSLMRDNSHLEMSIGWKMIWITIHLHFPKSKTFNFSSVKMFDFLQGEMLFHSLADYLTDEREI